MIWGLQPKNSIDQDIQVILLHLVVLKALVLNIQMGPWLVCRPSMLVTRRRGLDHLPPLLSQTLRI